MISPLRFFEIYNACVLHFKEGSSYDFFKYGGKTKVTQDTLLKRKDKYHFEKWAKKIANEDEAVGVIVSNTIKGQSYIIQYDWDNYLGWISYRDAVFYRFQEDLCKYSGKNKIVDPVQECFSGSTYPYNYMVIMNHVTNGFLFNHFSKKYTNDILWEDLQRKLLTYSPFVIKYWDIQGSNLEKIFSIVNKRVVENAK